MTGIDCPLAPVQDNLVVIDDDMEERIGQIILPEMAQDRPQSGTVIMVGPGKMISGVLVKPTCQPRDRVLFARFAGLQVEYKGRRWRIFKGEDEILTRITDEPRAPVPDNRVNKESK